jgi:hypothetical protein
MINSGHLPQMLLTSNRSPSSDPSPLCSPTGIDYIFQFDLATEPDELETEPVTTGFNQFEEAVSDYLYARSIR